MVEVEYFSSKKQLKQMQGQLKVQCIQGVMDQPMAYVIEEVDKSLSMVGDKIGKHIWGLKLKYFDMILTPEKQLNTFS